MRIRTFLAAVLLLAGCESARFDRVRMTKLVGDDLSEVSSQGVIVRRGTALMFNAQPLSEPGAPEYKGLERFKLISTNPDIAEIRRAVVRDAWVVTGGRPGSARMLVEIDGEIVDDIPLQVEE